VIHTGIWLTKIFFDAWDKFYRRI